MGQDFSEYLAFTVFLCVADNQLLLEKVGQGKRRWNLRENGWPAYPQAYQIKIANDWIKAKFQELLIRRNKNAPSSRPDESTFPEDVAWAITSPIRPQTLQGLDQTHLRTLLRLLNSKLLLQGGYNVSGYSPTSEDAAIERAIRSLHDWRATLNFLSELKLTRSNQVLLVQPEPAIVNSFNVHITRHRKPNLGHNMLCHLTGPARFRLILTTNFDELIEDASEELNERIKTISVSVKGELPAPDLVHSENMVVKLHGTLWETRADYTLDESPSPQSLRTFFHYIRGRWPEEEDQKPGFLPSHLLVCGYSGSDNRCMEMIKFVLDADQEAKVFWICHTAQQLNSLHERLFPESSYRAIDNNKLNRRVVAIAAPRPDLLLYELYQHLSLSLPKGGFSYQYTANVPPNIANGWLNTQDLKTLTEDENLQKTNSGRIVQWYQSSEKSRLAIIDGAPGVLATLRHSVECVTERRLGSVIWLELEDNSDVFCLAYELLLIISIRLGLFQLGHADMVSADLINNIKSAQKLSASKPDDCRRVWKNHIGSLVKNYFSIDANKWLIVFYARNGAGGCSGWDDGSFWGKSEFIALEQLIHGLCDAGFRVLYAPYTEEQQARDNKKPTTLSNLLKNRLGISNLSNESGCSVNSPVEMHDITHLQKSAERFAPDKYHEEINLPKKRPVSFESTLGYITSNWCNPTFVWRDESIDSIGENVFDRVRFLYAASLFRQSRHYSAFLVEGILQCPKRFNDAGFDNDWHRNKVVFQYRDKLVSKHVFNEKPGGFAWAYRDIRMGMRSLIESLPDIWYQVTSHNIAKQNSKRVEPFRDHRPTYHFWIADWYIRAFYTTGHALPLLEALYHYRQVIVRLKELAQRKRVLANSPEAWKRYFLWRSAICGMIKAFRIGKNAIRMWFGTAQFLSWFGKECKHVKKDIDPHSLPNVMVLPISTKNSVAELVALFGLEFDLLTPHGDKVARPKNYNTFILKNSRKKFGSVENRIPGPNMDIVDDTALLDHISANSSIGYILKKGNMNSGALKHQVERDREMFVKKHHRDEELFSCVQELTEWAFLFLKRAKIRQRLMLLRDEANTQLQKNGTSVLGLDSEVKKMFVYVSILCNTCLFFCRYLHPALESFEFKERVKALCLYSVSLARLGRFFEAHRRLNEAHALLSKHKCAETPVLLGILQLRRAEAHLCESVFVTKIAMNGMERLKNAGFYDQIEKRYFEANLSKDTRLQLGSNIALAKLDDAWCALESAEGLLAGQTHSPRWWARLCSLKLQCLSFYHNNRSMSLRTRAMRVPNEPFHQILTLLRKGTASCQPHSPLQLKLVDFAWSAANGLFRREGKEAVNASNVVELIGSMVRDNLHLKPTNTSHTLRDYALFLEKRKNIGLD